MPLLLGQIWALTPKAVKSRAGNVAIQLVSAISSEVPASQWIREPKYYTESVFKARSLRPDFRIYRVVIRQYSRIPAPTMRGLNKRLETWMHCSCPYFCFVCEFALTRYKSSSIIRSNGAYPKETNPRSIPYCCKHIACAILLRPSLNVPLGGVSGRELAQIKPRDVSHAEDVGILKTPQGPFLYKSKEADIIDEELDKLL